MGTQPVVRMTMPNLTVTLDQFIGAIHQLDESALLRVAEAVVERERDMRLLALIERLSKRISTDELTDAVIASEVQAVRKTQARRRHAQAGH
jgi:hypothetical protein